MRKDLLLQTVITFGLGWVLGMVFNPGSAPWSGLPVALAAAGTIAISQRIQQRRWQRSAASLRAQVAHLQGKAHALQHSILAATTEQAEVVTQLDAYSQRRQAAEQHITALETARQRMLAESQQIEEKLLALQAERETIAQSIAKITSDRQQLLDNQRLLQSEVGNSKQQLAAEQQELAASVAQLQAEQEHYYAANQELIQAHQDLSDEQLALADQLRDAKRQCQLEQQELELAIARLQLQQQQYLASTQQLTTEITYLSQTKQALQQDLDRLESQVVSRSNVETPVPLIVPAVLESEPAEIATAPTPAENWQDQFDDVAVRSVFEHLQEYGSVTEAELTQMLEGNPRKARQFALKFEEYLQLVPFQARVEVAASGKRYVRD